MSAAAQTATAPATARCLREEVRRDASRAIFDAQTEGASAPVGAFGAMRSSG